jgi:DNA-binding NarL/FixJ family response regulator
MASSPQVPAGAASSVPAPPRVVVIDDSGALRSMVRVVLTARGEFVVVGEAADGRAGLEAVAFHQPDIVLTDLQMPFVDGIELTSRLQGTHPHLPVVVLTGWSCEETEQRAIRAGAAGYVDKAGGLIHLGDVLREVLQRTPPS